MMTSYWHASALYALTRARCVQILFGSLHHSVALHVFDFFFQFLGSVFSQQSIFCVYGVGVGKGKSYLT